MRRARTAKAPSRRQTASEPPKRTFLEIASSPSLQLLSRANVTQCAPKSLPFVIPGRAERSAARGREPSRRKLFSDFEKWFPSLRDAVHRSAGKDKWGEGCHLQRIRSAGGPVEQFGDMHRGQFSGEMREAADIR